MRTTYIDLSSYRQDIKKGHREEITVWTSLPSNEWFSREIADIDIDYCCDLEMYLTHLRRGGLTSKIIETFLADEIRRHHELSQSSKEEDLKSIEDVIVKRDLAR